jgi:hypothetical protein
VPQDFEHEDAQTFNMRVVTIAMDAMDAMVVIATTT